jgi:hypothetical protein
MSGLISKGAYEGGFGRALQVSPVDGRSRPMKSSGFSHFSQSN